MDKAFDVKATSRLGCQSKIQSDTTVVVEISRESRQAFLDEHPDIRAALKASRGRRLALACGLAAARRPPGAQPRLVTGGRARRGR